MGLKTVLATLPGFPLRGAALAPNVDVLQAATQLRAQGHTVTVLDWGTLEGQERFDAPMVRRCIQRALHPHRGCTVIERMQGYRQARELNILLEHTQQERIDEALNAILHDAPEQVLFHVRDHAEFQTVRQVSFALCQARPDLMIGLLGTFARQYQDMIVRAMDPIAIGFPNFDDDAYDSLSFLEFYAERLNIYPFVLSPQSAQQERVMKQVDALVQRLDVPLFNFDADALTVNTLGDFARALVQRRLGAHFSLSCPIESLTEENISLLVLAGCRAVSVTIPTGSQRLLEDFYHQSFGVSKVESIFECIHSADLLSTVRLVYPCPLDDYHTAAETLRLLRRIRPTSVLVTPPNVIPASAWYERAIGYGFNVEPRRYVQWLSGALQGQSQEGQMQPYMMAGWSQQQIQKASVSLLEAIAEEGIQVGMDTMEVLLSWQSSGSDEALQTTFEKLNAAFADGDVEALRKFLTLIPVEQWQARGLKSKYKPFVPTLEAVGN